MPDHFISLNCANCGAKLDVYDDMERFACGYCGTEMLVQRRGGTVALRAVTDAIKKVQIGTDKTAAELALVRLDKERQQLRAEFDKAQTALATGPPGVACAILVAALLLLIGAGMASQGSGFLVFSIILSAGAAIWGYRRNAEHKREWTQKVAESWSKVVQIEREIEENRKTVKG